MIFQNHHLPPGGCYLFSYPRSGSNWLFSALTYLFDAVKAEARIGPEIYPVTYGEIGPETFWIQAAAGWSWDRPLLIKSHETVEIFQSLYPAGKAIYLLRDGRDALLSYYFYQQAFMVNPGNKTVFPTGRRQQDLGAVSDNEVRFDADRYVAFLQTHARDWVRHAQTWPSVPGVLLVRYEALQQNFEPELTRIVDYLALPAVHPVPEVREEYVEHARGLLTGDNRAFHRKGIVGDWKNHLDERICQALKEELSETLVQLGYESGEDW